MSMMQKLLEINDEAVRLRTECEQLRSDQKTLQEICAVGRQRITELQADLRKALGERDEALERAGRLQAELDATRKQLQSSCAGYSTTKSAGSGLLRDVSHYTEAAEVDTPDTDDAPAEPVKVREGRWRKRSGVEVSVSAMPTDHDDFTEAFPWWDGHETTWTQSGHLLSSGECPADLLEYLGPIEPQPEQDGVLVQEGWWLQADGNRVCVRPTNPSLDNIWKINIGFKWSDGARLYMDDGSHNRNQTTPHDLVKFLGKELQSAEPQQPKPEPEFKPYTFAAYIVGDKSQPDALRIVWATEEWIQHAKFGIVHRMRDMQFFGNDGGCNITEYHETLTLSLEVQ